MSLLADILKPNQNKYIARSEGQYLSSRLVTHNGTTIAIALGKMKRREKMKGSEKLEEVEIMFFEYSILNAEDQDPVSPQDKSPATVEKLDSQCWFENVKPLLFPTEVRVIGEEAVPVYPIPSLDRTGHDVDSRSLEKLDPWLSTSVCLMDKDVTNFEVLSDGKYVYLFRQSLSASSTLPNNQMTTNGVGMPPVDSNLLCDRFTLVGSSLNKALEPRYKRSGQKRIPLNERDTLGVRDINDNPFYEPTFSLRFIQNLVGGRFTVLRAPTITNDMYRWTFFAYSGLSGHIEYTSTDTSIDGLFDLHGKIYYTCDSKKHQDDVKIFANAPGSCTASVDDGKTCEAPRVPIMAPTPLSERALILAADVTLAFGKRIELSKAPFTVGFTLEAWVKPLSFWVSPCEEEAEPKASPTPPAGSFFCLFSQAQAGCPSVFLDDRLRPCLLNSDDLSVLAVSDDSLRADAWNHIAITYNASTRNFSLVINGAPTSALYTLPATSGPGTLSGFASQENKAECKFIGHIDETRLWSIPLHPDTIKSRMTTRATGMEPFLEACWHFDEGGGSTAFDATSNNHSLNVIQAGSAEPRQEIWEADAAPSVGSYGLARKRLRLTSTATIQGSLSAVIYNEQVSVSEANESSPSNTKAKQMKRGARVLLSFIVMPSGNSTPRLAVLDFGLLSNGQLCDLPATLPLPNLDLVSGGSRSAQRASTSLVHIDAQGIEVFGGVLAFDAANCGLESPCVFDSATGTVTIFFRNAAGTFAALDYDISRTITAMAPAIWTNDDDLLATSKLRVAKSVSIKSDICAWMPKEVAVNLTLTAQLADNSVVTEIWNGIPSSVDAFCDLLNGEGLQERKVPIGSIISLEYLAPRTPPASFPSLKITLEESLTFPIVAGTCVAIVSQRYQILRNAKVGDISLLASWYAKTNEDAKNHKPGQTVIALGYDHTNLVSCTGKAVGRFGLGSSLISLVRPQSAKTGEPNTSSMPIARIQAPRESKICGEGQSPFFASPPSSTALRLAGDGVYSMLENPITTPPCSGITFESWIKADQVKESILVAYTSERSRRSERSGNESQTVLLGIPGSSSSNQYELVGNVNGSLFSIKSPSLKQSQWVHFACSTRNTFALGFDGSSYVDLGAAPEWNVSDFSLTFTLQLDQVGGRDQILFVKSANNGGSTPLHLKVTTAGTLCLSYWAEGERGEAATERIFLSDNGKLCANVPYKIFVSRKYMLVNKKDSAPRPYQVVTMRAWCSDGTQALNMSAKDIKGLEAQEMAPDTISYTSGAAQTHGAVQSNDESLNIAGGLWSDGQGLVGSIGSIRLYSSAIATPTSLGVFSAQSESDKSLIASYSCFDAGGFIMIDDLGRNNGKLKKDPAWKLSPFELDHQLSFFVNGVRQQKERPNAANLLQTPVGLHQLTLGNALHGDNETRYMALPNNFCGELDELRIWNVPRTKENICDSMHTRLSDISPEVAVYLPFDHPDTEWSQTNSSTINNIGILADSSNNCWHLTALNGARAMEVPSEAPIGRDAPCVNHVLGGAGQKIGIPTCATPSVGEYGDMQVSASGSMEGSFKRMYSYINTENQWCLVTGFRIGALITEWVGQVQTEPTLKGYIEGAPPIPVESFVEQSDEPSSSIRFTKAEECSYSYSSRSETVNEFDVSYSRGAGIEWEVSAGIGVETKVSSGEIKAAVKAAIDISNGQVNTAVSTSTTNSDMEMRVELTGTWTPRKPDELGPMEIYEPSNTGLALVESEVADVFALRLQMRGGNAPLVAYQMRPNPDIPKDRNLVSFEINPTYTKQGCLDGRNGLMKDKDYPPATQTPKDASYFKPLEAYAMRDRIRRAEEQRQGEFDRYSASTSFTSGIKPIFGTGTKKEMPQRTHRNICNSYVWTADGGTFQEKTSTMDEVQAESGGNFNSKTSIGASLDIELAFSSIQATTNVDAMYNCHYNLSLTKEKTSSTSFALEADFPPAVDIRRRDEVTGKLVKRPGAVDAYRWMSFWLEESVEATDVFFNQVLDPQWLEESTEPNAALLRSLNQSIKKEAGNARTKAWRVLHRCTYVSRVPAKVEGNPKGAAAQKTNVEDGKKSTLLADVACNWQILQNLEPWIRGASSRAELAVMVRSHVARLYPRLVSQPRFYAQVLDLLADYIGCS